MSEGEDIFRALSPLLDALEILGIGYYIGGSLASSTHGLPRSSMDADLVCDLVPEALDRLADRLGTEYYFDVDAAKKGIRERSAFNMIHQETFFKIDVFPLGRTPYELEAFRRRSQEDLGNRRAFFCSPEDIVLRKLEWFRKGGGVSERQWSDVQGILRVLRKDLDRRYLSRWAPELGVEDLLKRALEEAV